VAFAEDFFGRVVGRTEFLWQYQQIHLGAVQRAGRVLHLRYQRKADARPLGMGARDHARDQHTQAEIRHRDAEFPVRFAWNKGRLGRDRAFDAPQHIVDRIAQHLGAQRGLHPASDLDQQFVIEVFAQARQGIAHG
jgi:hypothetical protein